MKTQDKNWVIDWTKIAMFLCCAIWAFCALFLGPYNATLNGWALLFIYVIGIIMALKANDKVVYPFVMFLIYCCVSNLGQTITHLFNIPNESNFDIYRSYGEDYIGRMLFYQGIFVLCMIIGYMLFRRKKEVVLQSFSIQQGENTKVGLEELIFWISAIYVGVTYLGELVQRTNMSYGDYFYNAREGVGTVMQYVYHVSAFAYIIRNGGLKRKIAYVITIILSVMAIFIGSRSVTIPLIVGFAFIIMSSQKGKIKFKFKYLVVGFIVLFVFSRFTLLRDYSLTQITPSLLVEVFAVSPIRAIGDIIQEMGVSARTVLTTMQGLDIGVIEHGNTISYYLLKGLFPLQILNILGVDAPAIESLSAWVSEYGSGGEGWGFSIIGEIIYNFGGWGVIFSFVFGAAIAGLENLMERLINKEQHYLASGILYVLGYSVFLARAETSLLSTRIRYTVYFLIILFIMKVINNTRGKTSKL